MYLSSLGCVMYSIVQTHGIMSADLTHNTYICNIINKCSHVRIRFTPGECSELYICWVAANT